MGIEPIGLVMLIICLICLQIGHQAMAVTLVIACLLGSAAAVLLGAANLPPAHFVLPFLVASTLMRRAETAHAIEALRFPGPGFWLTCLAVYGILTGYLMPRLLAGSMPIIPLGVSLEYANTGSFVPLGPVSSNLTQSIYLVGDLSCFVMLVAIASTRTGFAAIASALVAYAAGNAIFALLDIITYNTGTQWLMEPIRNATYTLHIDEEVSGLKRIVGSFTEASSFAGSTIPALAFVGTLWLCGHRPFITGSLAIVSLILLVLSTSSAGLAGTPPLLIILYVTALTRGTISFRKPFMSAFLICVPVIGLSAVLALQLDDAAWKPIRDYVDVLIFSKAGSQSAIERGTWNTLALANFFGSFGLGVGLGTARASSFPIALLSNVGVPGTLFYMLFVGTAFFSRRGGNNNIYTDVRLAARNACLTLIICGCFAGTAVDQGLLFYVFAAMAFAAPERQTIAYSRPASMRPQGVRI